MKPKSLQMYFISVSGLRTSILKKVLPATTVQK